MSNANLVKYIWVSACAVAYDDTRPIDKTYDIRNDCRIFPNVIGPPAAEANSIRGGFQAVKNGRKARVEGHHG